MKKIRLFLKCTLFAICCIVSTQCTAQTADPEVLKDIAANDSTLIVDVRTPEEFEAGHIGRSVNIPLAIIADSARYLEKQKHVILVCRSGNRSLKAKTQLEEGFGLQNLYNGGGWQSLNALLTKQEEE